MALALAKQSPFARLLKLIRFMPSGCVEWTGGKVGRDRNYGQITVDGVSVYVHRFAYEFLVGPIPDGMVIDHVCLNTLCVNPDHMEPVTTSENVRRGIRAKEKANG
jgi:HNH endonuclease